MTGVAVAQVGSAVRVAVTGLGSGIYRWQAAEQALQRRLSPEALQNCVLDAGIAMGDIHASAAFRAHLAAVLTRRAVQHILKSSTV